MAPVMQPGLDEHELRTAFGKMLQPIYLPSPTG